MKEALSKTTTFAKSLDFSFFLLRSCFNPGPPPLTPHLEDLLGRCGELLRYSGVLEKVWRALSGSWWRTPEKLWRGLGKLWVTGGLWKALSGSWQGSLEALRALWDSGKPPGTLEEFLGIL